MRIHLFLLLFGFAFSPWCSAQSEHALDANLAPKADEEVSNVFRDMGVVQRRAMPKANRWLFSTFASLDFSDGPYSNYSIHFNPGYAINDFWEVYVNFAPLYIVQARSIVNKVAVLGTSLSPQQTFIITAGRPSLQYGIDVLWSPLYGKDSLGISRIIRSDTFLKFGASNISYDVGSGLLFKLGIGKSFFLSKNAAFRFCIDYAELQSWYGSSIGSSAVTFSQAWQGELLTEFGAMFYL